MLVSAGSVGSSGTRRSSLSNMRAPTSAWPKKCTSPSGVDAARLHLADVVQQRAPSAPRGAAPPAARLASCASRRPCGATRRRRSRPSPGLSGSHISSTPASSSASSPSWVWRPSSSRSSSSRSWPRAARASRPGSAARAAVSSAPGSTVATCVAQRNACSARDSPFAVSPMSALSSMVRESARALGRQRGGVSILQCRRL